MMIPHRLRQLRMIVWVKVFVSYLIKIKEDLLLFWSDTVRQVMITPQVLVLEKTLNDRFSSTDIFISEGFTLGPYIFLNSETADPEFYMDQADSWVYSLNDATDVDFVVNIPESLANEIPLIAAIVHKYKLPGKCFVIQKF